VPVDLLVVKKKNGSKMLPPFFGVHAAASIHPFSKTYYSVRPKAYETW